MTDRKRYQPGPATSARIHDEGGRWALVLERRLRHPPARVWEALTDPAHLVEWAPFDADRSLAQAGPVRLTTIGAPAAPAESVVTRAEAPTLLEYTWGGNALRWELEAVDSGTRLTLWHHIDRRFISWGAAGWHICFDVLAALLDGDPLGRRVGPQLMQDEGWRRLQAEYATQLGVDGAGGGR